MPEYLPNELLSRLVGRRLNGVVFSMDYVILWFDGDQGRSGNVTLNCDVYPVVQVGGSVHAERDYGYGDALRSLVPEVVEKATEGVGTGITICFPSGRLMLHPAADEFAGPEIAMLSGFADGRWMCWRPGEDSFEDLA